MFERKGAVLLGALVIALLIAPGCVGKKMFRSNVEDTDSRVAAVESAVEGNQRQLNDLRKSTDQKLNGLQSKTDAAMARGNEAFSKAEAAEATAGGKLIWTVTLTDDKVKFEFGQAQLTADAMTELDNLVSRVKSMGKALYLELEGHTDNVGPNEKNLALGELRAMAVRDYLNNQGVPLHALSTISYGESKPIADNSTRDGRAQNRRVVIKVLE